MSILYNCPNKGIHPIHQIISNLHHNRTSLSKPFDIIPICGPLSGKIISLPFQSLKVTLLFSATLINTNLLFPCKHSTRAYISRFINVHSKRIYIIVK